MKLIKCLNAQCLTEYIGIVDNAVKPPCFYTVDYINQFGYTETFIHRIYRVGRYEFKLIEYYTDYA